PLRADRCRLSLEGCAAMRTGGDWRMMEEDRDVGVAPSVEGRDLRPHPRKLRPVVGNFRVISDEKRVAVAERVRWVPGEATRRALGWNELRVRCEIISQPAHPPRVGEVDRVADVVIADSEKIGDVTLAHQPVDERRVADVELGADAAILNRV